MTEEGRMTYLSHTQAQSGRIGLLQEHLESVARTAEQFASRFGAGREAHIAGLFHDLGKYSALFQRRLRGEVSGIDHWSIGAWAILTKYRLSAIAAALAIQGHHAGLQSAEETAIKSLDPTKLRSAHPLALRVPDEDLSELLERLHADVDSVIESVEQPIVEFEHFHKTPAQAMFSTRMLFSALVDADFIETEAHFQSTSPTEKSYRQKGPPLKPDQALKHLLTYVTNLSRTGTASSPEVDQVRQSLLRACLSRAEDAPGVYTLTAPTGSGKTLASLAYALKHASVHNMDRVIVVLPFLSLIEQTVGVFHNVFGDKSSTFVLEDHSLVAEGSRDAEADSDKHRQQTRMLSENWDAPIIVTTGVRFLESLFANRPGACRKLHNLSNAVTIMDEVQTLPLSVTIPTLATLSHLSQRFRSTIVFSTATQPAFDHLDECTRKYSTSGWQPGEIVDDAPNMFDILKRTDIVVDTEPLDDWETLVDETSSEQQIMYVVNLKRHACHLFECHRATKRDGLLHLSTNMCPEHRRRVLAEATQRLASGQPCCLVSTQCVEAGVDIDFPTVCRAMAPLECIVQAAGRCNRNGKNPVGKVRVFFPPADGRGAYPSGFYQQAASVTELVLKSRGSYEIDTADLALFREYYRQLYSFARPEALGENLREAIERRDFRETANHYRIIPGSTTSVLVPYDPQVFQTLAKQARIEGINRTWIRKARSHAVGIYRNALDDPRLERVTVRFTQEEARDWVILLDSEVYDSALGLTIGLPRTGADTTHEENYLIA